MFKNDQVVTLSREAVAGALLMCHPNITVQLLLTYSSISAYRQYKAAIVLMWLCMLLLYRIVLFVLFLGFSFTSWLRTTGGTYSLPYSPHSKVRETVSVWRWWTVHCLRWPMCELYFYVFTTVHGNQSAVVSAPFFFTITFGPLSCCAIGPG